MNKAKKLIQDLCDADNRHPMAKEEIITIEFMQSLHALSKIDTQTEFGIKEVSDKKGAIIH